MANLNQYVVEYVVSFLPTTQIHDLIQDSQDLLTLAAQYELRMREKQENEMLLTLSGVYAE
jgi:hypothetical protein